MPVVMDKRLLDVKSAAKYLSIGTTLLYQWIKAGKISCLKMNTKTLIDVDDLDQFVENLKVEQGLKKGA